MALGAGFELGEVAPADAHGDVDYDQDVENQDEDLEDGDIPVDFIKFEGNETGGGDNDHPFGPCLVEQQADAFHREEPGIDEGANTEQVEGGTAHAQGSFEKTVNEFVFFVNSNGVN